MNRRDFTARLAGTGFGAAGISLGLASWSLPASAQGNAPVEGKQFVRLQPPVTTTEPGKIEVIEFFSYACPHCAAFEPTIASWSEKLPADVAFQRVPVPFLMNAENFMRTYYALETMGLVATVQPKVFAALHVERQRLDKAEDIAALVAKSGGDGAKFLEIFKSFSVASSVTRAKKLASAYRVDSVPTVAVQGRYVTSPAQAGGHEQTMAVVDYLIQRSRKG